jgi:hypothetical protein
MEETEEGCGSEEGGEMDDATGCTAQIDDSGFSDDAPSSACLS